MKKALLLVVVAGLLGFSAIAWGQVAPPPVAKPGPETKLLEPLLGKHKRAGTKTPPMRAPISFTGTIECGWVAGVWLSCDIHDKHDAKDFPNLDGRLILGWDFLAGGYRGFLVTGQGASIPLAGAATDGKLVMESTGMLKGPMGTMAMRLTLDLTNPKAIGYLDERSINRTPWFPLETSTLQ